MSGHVEVRFELNGRQLDLAVPSGVGAGRLREIIARVLSDNGVVMPKEWGLCLKGKPLGIPRFEAFGGYPIGNGDVFQIVTEESGE